MLLDPVDSRVTDLAYLACLVAVPCDRDPTVPQLAFGVPNRYLRGWIEWVTIPDLLLALRKIAEGGPRHIDPEELIDKRYPTLRLPRLLDGTEGSGGSE